jgi:signal transduction histidine kinase
MSVALGIGGWLIGMAGVGAAAIIRVRLARQAEAVARACHEVRGPLTAVQLGLELGGRVRQLSHSRLRAIELELGRAAVALDDLSAAGVPCRPARTRSVEAGELVATSVEGWRAVAAVQGATIVFEAAPQPLWVVGDRLRLAQAIGNLLANAIEHGGGAVVVSLRVAAEMVRLEVVDGGPGLPAPIDELVRRRRRRGGPERGHGLRVAGAVAAAHGGRLASAPSDRGARMVLELPSRGRWDDIDGL